MDNKPTVYAFIDSQNLNLGISRDIQEGKKTTKGNVDAELVLYAAAKEFSNFDEAVIVTGDGDFACLLEYLEDEGKLRQLLIPNKHNYSSLLKPFLVKADYISTRQKRLEKSYHKKGRA